MIKQMSPADVRELLGISRSAMRYYMSKGLISAKKNEENGYSYFSGNDLLELIDVAYYRNCMDADADDIKRLTFAPSLMEMEANYEEEIDAYEKKIKKQYRFSASVYASDDFYFTVPHTTNQSFHI